MFRSINSISKLYKRIRKIVNSRILKRWGNPSQKKAIWDKEFTNGQWDYLENTGDDPIYHYLERFSNEGSILDLGCGSGNTGNEMDTRKYVTYTGVDISDSAIQIASDRSRNNFRQDKNEYVCADIFTYVPKRKYDVILFRESIFYIPKSKIRGVIDRFSDYLKERGVFIVRICDKKKYESIVGLIKKHYCVLDKSSEDDTYIILVFK